MKQSVLRFIENCLCQPRLSAVVLSLCAIWLAACAVAQDATAAVTETAGPTLNVTSVPTLAVPRSSQTSRPLPTSTAETLTPTATEANETPTAIPTFGVEIDVTVGDNGLRLRPTPDTHQAISGIMAPDTPLTIIGKSSDDRWLLVSSSNQEGWIPVHMLEMPINFAHLAIPIEAILTPPPPTQTPPPGGARYISGISAYTRSIFIQGQQMGNRPNVFSKIGDSITVASYFLYPVGWGQANLRDYAYLQPVIQYFSLTPARDANSFANNSLAADNGWTTEHLLDTGRAHPELCQTGETPLVCELRVTRPSVALIMIGTNDTANVPIETFRSNLYWITETSIAMGVIPVLSTIPDRDNFEDEVRLYNDAIIEAAHLYDVPLWDYRGATQFLPNRGLDADGIHPSWPEGDLSAAADFTPENLRFGYTVRNLTALQVLDALWRSVM